MWCKTRSRNTEAVVWVMLGTALFSLVFASGKFAADTASPLQIVFLRYVGGFVTLLCVVFRVGGGFRPHVSERPFSHLLRAVFGAYGGVAIIYASANMPIMDATAISLLNVVFVVALGVLFLGERIGRQQRVGIVLGFIGAGIVVTSRGAFRQFDFSYFWPASIALLGAILVALEGIMIKTLTRTDRPLTVLLYVNLFGIVLLAIPALAAWRSPAPMDNLPFLILGPIAIAAQYCIIRGYQIADVSVVGPIDYTWLVFAALIGFLFFNEVPTAGVWIGSAFIAAGGIVLAALRPKRQKKSLSQ